MNFRDLEYVVAVSETLHFGRAAQRCFVSQPTLSGQIHKLEEEIAALKPEFMPFDIAVADLSFISLRKVLPNIAKLMPATCEGLFLVKPQFEVGPENIGKSGLVKNLDDLIAQLEDDVKTCCTQLNLTVKDFFHCELKGGDGNQEYFVYAAKNIDVATNQ